MANEHENLIPLNQRTKDEQREITQKGGKASGVARRRKADLRKIAEGMITGDISEMMVKSLIDIAADPSNKNAVSAFKEVRDLLGQNKTALDVKEQKARVEQIKAQTEKLKPEDISMQGTKYTGIPASMVAPVFAPVLFDIHEHNYTEYVFPGGRGSTKSSFVSLQVIDLIMRNDNMHAVVMRQVADTLRGSVYQQIMWAIDVLELTEEFHATVSPMEITRKSTGQKIYFRGADDPGKIKSIKVPFGYIGILWFEELDQFAGPE